MRDRTSVVGRYMRLREEWLRLRKKQAGLPQSWELASLDSAVRALGWALGVDPEVGTAPRFGAAEMQGANGAAPLRGVRLTGAWEDVWRNPPNPHKRQGKGDNKKAKRYWLLEVAADRDSGMEYWAVFLSERHVAELALAFGAATFHSSADVLYRMSDVRGRADGPTVADVRTLIERTDWSEMGQPASPVDGGAA